MASTEPVRILAVSHAYPRPARTGHGVFIHRLHQGLRECGAEVQVLQLVDWAPPWPVSEARRVWRTARHERNGLVDELDGVRIHHPTTFMPVPSRLFRADWWEQSSRALIGYTSRRRELARSHVVLGHFMVPDGYQAVRLARALGRPVVGFAWGDDLHRWPSEDATWRAKLGCVLDEADGVVACSHRMAADGNSWLSVPRDDWAVVYAGVDTDRFRPTTDPMPHRARAVAQLAPLQARDAKMLLMLGQRVRAKGYLEMLDAWAEVAPHATHWHLVMAGDDRGDVNLDDEIRVRSLGTRAHWIGPQPAERIPELLRASDGFVLPSHAEGLSLSVLEAMATGLPTIASDVGGHGEVITTREEGWLVPPKDVGALVAALRHLVSEPDPKRRWGTAARAAAERIGSPGTNASRLLMVLTDVVARYSGRRAVAMPGATRGTA